MNLSKSDQLQFIELALPQLSLQVSFKLRRRPTKAGSCLTPLEVREAVWDFWHRESTASTLTSRPAKLKVTDKPKIQSNLRFIDTVNIIKQRNQNFYENIWFVTMLITYKKLFDKYCHENPDNSVGSSTFMALQPLYVRTAIKKDVEMYCCKLHLHARWRIKALLECANTNQISLPFHDYDTFSYLTRNCPPSETTYVSWECAIDKKLSCSGNWKLECIKN